MPVITRGRQPRRDNLKIKLDRPHSAQQRIIDEAKRFNIVVCGRRFGKALSLDTPIPTPDGWTTMGDLREGDRVLDERGLPCAVTFATEVMHDRPCFRVRFSDGAEIVADAEHQWTVSDKRVRRSGRDRRLPREPFTVTTAEMAANLRANSRELNYSIPTCGALDLPERDLPVEPYTLGAWLGDGHTASANLTTVDLAILDRVRADGYAVVQSPSLAGSITHRVGRVRNAGEAYAPDRVLQTELRALGVLGNKRIPLEYRRASHRQRLELLRGMMDTDGTVGKSGGHCSYTTKLDGLADDFCDLIGGLGVKWTRRTKRAGDGLYHEVNFSPVFQVFHLPRKAERWRGKFGPERSRRYVTEIEPVPSVPVRCITVDSPNSLYLAGKHYIPTHNTKMGINRAVLAALEGQPVGWFSPTYRMLSEVWRELCEVCAPIARRINNQEHRIDLVGKGFIEMWSLDNPDACRGRKYRRIIVDEAAQVKSLKEAWQNVLRPTLADLEGDAWFLSTPRGMNFFYTLWSYGDNKDMTEWSSWQMPTSANPYIKPSEVQAMGAELPKTIYEQEVLAQFIPDGSGVFRGVQDAAVPPEEILRTEAEKDHEYVFGVDLAKYQDFSVVTVLDATTRRVVAIDRFNEMDYTTQALRIKSLYASFKPRQVIVESNSIGGPFTEMLRAGTPVKYPAVCLVADGTWLYAYHEDGKRREGPFPYPIRQNAEGQCPYEPSECRHGKIVMVENSLFIDRDLWYGGDKLEGMPVQPWTTTNATKAEAIDALALAFEHRQIKIPNDPILIGELHAFEGTRTPSGMMRYAAPEGMHDDCVISLMLAWQGIDAGAVQYMPMPHWWR